MSPQCRIKRNVTRQENRQTAAENVTAMYVPLWMKRGIEVQTHVISGNKNVRQLKNAAGTVIATNDYDPFGNVTATGSVTPWQFSSEYRDAETGLVYYNYCHYAPTIGRWINRDPIEEKGGMNLYEIFHNSITMSWDSLGYWDGLLPWIFRKIFGNIQFNTLCECGYIIKRRIEYQGDGAWEDLHSSTVTFVVPYSQHWLVKLADGTTLNHGSTKIDENHYTATKHPIYLESGDNCDDFTACMKENWPPSETYDEIFNNCKDAVINTIKKCRAKV